MYSTCCRSNVFNSSVAGFLPISIKWAGKESHIHFLEVCLILTEQSTISSLWLCHFNQCTALACQYINRGKGKLNRQNSTKAPWIQGIWTEGSPLWGFPLSNKHSLEMLVFLSTLDEFKSGLLKRGKFSKPTFPQLDLELWLLFAEVQRREVPSPAAFSKGSRKSSEKLGCPCQNV